MIRDLIRASSLNGFSAFCRQQQVDGAQMLQQAGLAKDIEQHPDHVISYQRFIHLQEQARQHSGNPFFGLEYGLFQGTDIFGPLLYLFSNAGTVGQALHELVEHFHLHSGAAEVRLRPQGRLTLLTYDVHQYQSQPLQQACELAIGVGIRVLQTLLGEAWRPKSIHLQHRAHSPHREYEKRLGVVPEFNAGHNALALSSGLLDTPLSSADPRLHALMQQHLQQMENLSIQELPARLRQLLHNRLPTGRVTLERISGFLLLSPRTLQRYLAAENTSFQQLLDETRQALAERYLRDSSIPLSLVAGMLGYGSSSAFSRAFAGWHGISPRQWRQQRSIAATRRRRD